MMNRLLKSEPTVGEISTKCIEKCRALMSDAAVPGIQYKDQVKQLAKFSKSLLIPLEDLLDNTYEDASLATKAVADVRQVCR
jgi:hypothetical protein